jgi:hypothetical protein
MHLLGAGCEPVTLYYFHCSNCKILTGTLIHCLLIGQPICKTAASPERHPCITYTRWPLIIISRLRRKHAFQAIPTIILQHLAKPSSTPPQAYHTQRSGSIWGSLIWNLLSHLTARQRHNILGIPHHWEIGQCPRPYCVLEIIQSLTWKFVVPSHKAA